jgi:hypothetical protein
MNQAARKLQLNFNGQHGVIFQKIDFEITDVRALNPVVQSDYSSHISTVH